MTTTYTPQRFAREASLIGLTAIGATLLFELLIYPVLGLSTDGPLPIRSIIMMGVILLLARSHSEGWRGLGLGRPRWIWLVPILAILVIASKLFLITPLNDVVKEFVGAPPSDHSAFDAIYGNLPVYLTWLAIAWTAGAFAEEIIFRGFLLNRIAEIMGQTRIAYIAAVLGQALIFGLAHAYQGPGGMLTVGLGAVFSGIFFLLFKRNLWPLIIAHGAWDTLGLTLIYLNGSAST